MTRYFTKVIPADQISKWNDMVKKHINLQWSISKESNKEVMRTLYNESHDIEQEFIKLFGVNIEYCKPIGLTVSEINKVLGNKSDVQAIKIIIECLLSEPTEQCVNKVYRKCIERLSDKEKTIYLLLNHSDINGRDKELFKTVNHLWDEVRKRDCYYSVKELSDKYNITDGRVRQLYNSALIDIVSNIKPVLADIYCVDYKDRTLDQCVNMPQRVHSVLVRAFRYPIPYIETELKTLGWIIQQDYNNDDLRGLGKLTFSEMDSYFTEKLGLDWKRSKLYINLYNHYNKDDMSGKVIGITKDRMKEIIIKAKDAFCDGNKQCKGLGCQKCITSKFGLTKEEYTMLFK